jgi:hypothetical protein
MSRIIRLAALLVVLGGLATALVAYATAGPPNHANKLEATFTETVQVVTNHLADYGILQVILTGSGTLEGLGAATEVGGVTADRAVQPCGTPSEDAANTRRIVTAEGILAIRESAETCQTPAGRVATGTFEVDGLFSTGVFAGATGSGTVVNVLTPHTLTLSGKLNLANDEG